MTRIRAHVNPLVAAVVFLSLSATARAASEPETVLIKYLFNDPTLVASFANPGLDPGSLLPSGLIADGEWSASAPGTFDSDGLNLTINGVQSRAVAATDWHDADGNALLFSLNVAPDKRLAITEIRFFQQGSGGANGNGPSQWTLKLNGETLGSGTTTLQAAEERVIDGVSLANFASDLTGAIAFEISALGASANTATWRIDNFTIAGTLTAVPLPGALWLMGGALAGAAFRIRRQRTQP